MCSRFTWEDSVEHTTSFEGERAPCGRLGPADRREIEDEDGLVLHETRFACGCRSVHREFHDGSFHRKVVRHNGRVLRDELTFER
jgi:hypothetical protein